MSDRCPACGKPTGTGGGPTTGRCRSCGVSLVADERSVDVVSCAEEGQKPARVRVALPPEFLEQYRPGTMLGYGGMGAVYEATRVSTGRQVAMKFMFHPADADAVARFVREGRAMAKVSHPNVVKIHDVGAVGVYRYLVAELITGGDLKSRMVKGRPMPVRGALSIMLDCLAGLEACHARGIVHRDFKPGNVMFDASGAALLTDFGLARFVDDTPGLTRPGSMIGTPRYVAPEQIVGLPVGPAADVYSAGAVLFEMLTGFSLFTASTVPELLQKHLQAPPPDLATMLPSCPEGLAKAVAMALAKRPEERHPSAGAFAEELRGVLARMDGEARPAGSAAGRAPGRAATAFGVTSGGRLVAALLAAAFVVLTITVVVRRPPGGDRPSVPATPSPARAPSEAAPGTPAADPERFLSEWRRRLSRLESDSERFLRDHPKTQVRTDDLGGRTYEIRDPVGARVLAESMAADLVRLVVAAREAGFAGEEWLEVEPLGGRVSHCAGVAKLPADSAARRHFARLYEVMSRPIDGVYERCVALAWLPWLESEKRRSAVRWSQRADGHSRAAGVLEEHWRAQGRPASDLELHHCMDLHHGAVWDWERLDSMGLMYEGTADPHKGLAAEFAVLDRLAGMQFERVARQAPADPSRKKTVPLLMRVMESMAGSSDVDRKTRERAAERLLAACALLAESVPEKEQSETVTALRAKVCGKRPHEVLTILGPAASPGPGR